MLSDLCVSVCASLCESFDGIAWWPRLRYNGGPTWIQTSHCIPLTKWGMINGRGGKQEVCQPSGLFITSRVT